MALEKISPEEFARQAEIEEERAHAAAVERFSRRFLRKRKDLEVDKIFRALVKLDGSDLHMKVGRPPLIRVDGTLKELNRGPVDPEEMVRLLVPMMNTDQLNTFEKEGGADFAYTCEVEDVIWRFRVNMFQQRQNIGLDIK